LLDGECRIRWAGSGPSQADEREGLVKGVRKLVEDLKVKRKQSALAPSQSRAPEKKVEAEDVEAVTAAS
jgi:ATPase complex subunit ATP10